MLDQRRRRWASIDPALCECDVLPGKRLVSARSQRLVCSPPPPPPASRDGDPPQEEYANQGSGPAEVADQTRTRQGCGPQGQAP